MHVAIERASPRDDVTKLSCRSSLVLAMFFFQSPTVQQYEKRFEKDDRHKDRRRAREAMSDKIRMKMEFRQQVGL